MKFFFFFLIGGYTIYKKWLKMMSRLYTNLLDLASGNFPVMDREKKRLPRVMTVPGVIPELDDDQANSVSSDVPSLVN